MVADKTPNNPTANQTVQDILDIAQDLCQQHGYNGFSYKDISRLLQIKTSSIHYYYPKKEDLAEALIIRYQGEFAAELARIRAAEKNPKKQLEKFGALLEKMDREQKLCLCTILVADLEFITEKMRLLIVEFFDQCETWIKQCLVDGKKAGVFTFSGRPERIARGFLASLEGMLIYSRAFKRTDFGKVSATEKSRFSENCDWLFSLVQ